MDMFQNNVTGSSSDSNLAMLPSHLLIQMIAPMYQLSAHDQLAPAYQLSALDHLQVIADQTFELSIFSLSCVSWRLSTAVLCSLRKATEQIAEHPAR